MAELTAAQAYELRIGRWSRLVAREFLDWLAPAKGLAWLDVGCGGGALSDAVLEHCEPKSLIGIDPQAGVAEATQAAHNDPRADFRCINAQDMPFEEDSCDLAVSGLVLNFIEDQEKALAEMKRVVRPGGAVAGYVWDFGGRMELFRVFWDSARALDPSAIEQDHGVLYADCRPGPLAELFQHAGFEDVEVSGITVEISYGDFNEFWQPLLIGTGGIPQYAQNLSDQGLVALEARARKEVSFRPDGGFSLCGRAWALRGLVPG